MPSCISVFPVLRRHGLFVERFDTGLGMVSRYEGKYVCGECVNGVLPMLGRDEEGREGSGRSFHM